MFLGWNVAPLACPHRGSDFAAVLVGHEPHRVADHVPHAGLDDGVGENRADRICLPHNHTRRVTNR